MLKATTIRTHPEYLKALEDEIEAHGGLSPLINVLLYEKIQKKKLKLIAAMAAEQEDEVREA